VEPILPDPKAKNGKATQQKVPPDVVSQSTKQPPAITSGFQENFMKKKSDTTVSPNRSPNSNDLPQAIPMKLSSNLEGNRS
jgi:hypothetical protein